MSLPLISIIVPIHNAGSYLNKCLSSLINQTLEDIEIILVLDKPTDGSNKIAEEFASKDKRIKLLHNECNLHTGLSRNKGMDAACGEYIGFMDHDDYCEPSMLEKLYKRAKEKDSDIVRCNFSCIYTQNGVEQTEQYDYPEESYEVSDKSWIYRRVSDNSISCVIWNHIYKREFLQKHSISFLDSRNICSEDSIFFLEAYHYCERFDTVLDYLYHHIFHTSNTGKAYNYRSIKNRIAFFEKLQSILLQYNVDEDNIKAYMSQNELRSLYSGARQALDNLPMKDAVKEIRAIGNNTIALDNTRYIYSWRNRQKLLQLKPTIIILFFIIKSIYCRQNK